MRRFKDILVVTPLGTDAEATVTVAAELAAANDARLSLFDVVAPFPSRRRTRVNPELSRYLQGVITEQRELELEEIVRRTVGSRASVAVGVGMPFIEIVRRVALRGHDLVITPPDQPAGLLGLGRASTTMHLLRKCPVPVWVHRPEITDRRDVVAAVGPFSDDEPTGLDRKLVELGSSLADRMGGRFHVVHAWELEGESLLRYGRAKLGPGEVDLLVEEAGAAAEESVAKLLAETGLTERDAAVNVVKSRPVPAIVGVANEVKPGVVVMGTASRGGVAGLLIGNTAESTLGELDCSVLAVKPDGFISPIEV
jgi:nucleotide-binding universal stress UspA family protein